MSSDICLLPERIMEPQKNKERVLTSHDCHPDYAYISICVELKIKDSIIVKKGHQDCKSRRKKP
jgi:hypothetical protein